MGPFTKVIAWVGFAASLGLCAFDGVTSYQGVRLLLGAKDNRPFAVFMPMILAVLALCFNGLSPYMFRMYKERRSYTFAQTITFVVWGVFVFFDITSSLIGMLDAYSTVRVTSWETALDSLDYLGPAGGLLVILMAILITFGPFLACQFYDLAISENENLRAR